MLKNLVKEKFFPESLFEEKFVLVPSKGLENHKIHFTNSYNCENLRKSSYQERVFYDNLFQDTKQLFIHSEDFKTINVNDLLNENKYCHNCVLKAPLNFTSSDFTLNHLIEDLKVYDKEIQLLKNNESEYAYERLNTLRSLRFIRSLSLNHECFKVLVEEFLALVKLKHLSTKAHFDALRISAININASHYFNTLDSTGTFIENYVLKCADGLKKELADNTDFVIFSTVISLFGSYKRNYTLEDEFESLITLHPTFSKEAFTVLPYVEFMALKIKDAVVSSAHDVKKTVIVSNFPSKEILATMESLFDESNETMSDYEELYRIATTV